MYGSVPGEDLVEWPGTMALPALICNCGQVIPTGISCHTKSRDENIASFQRSLSLARQYRSDERWLEARFRWTAEFATRDEVADLTRQIRDLQKAADLLSEQRKPAASETNEGASERDDAATMPGSAVG